MEATDKRYQKTVRGKRMSQLSAHDNNLTV